MVSIIGKTVVIIKGIFQMDWETGMDYGERVKEMRNTKVNSLIIVNKDMASIHGAAVTSTKAVT